MILLDYETLSSHTITVEALSTGMEVRTHLFYNQRYRR